MKSQIKVNTSCSDHQIMVIHYISIIIRPQNATTPQFREAGLHYSSKTTADNVCVPRLCLFPLPDQVNLDPLLHQVVYKVSTTQ